MSMSTARTKRCILCGGPDGTGDWQVCGPCRDALAGDQATPQPRMAPDHSIVYLTPRRSPVTLGEIYCPTCKRRFRGKRRK